jgi:16S rRNA C967 or C1407 C5-methylase (RsmB/RsmF family)
VKCSFPKWLYDALVKQYGYKVAQDICHVSNGQAPLTIRVNPSKISRELLLLKWKDKEVSPCSMSPLGINFKKKQNVFELEEFHQGCFEVQDEASQMISFLVKCKPGQQVMDYCAGKESYSPFVICFNYERF